MATVHFPNFAATYSEGMITSKNILEAWEVCYIPANRTTVVPDSLTVNGTLTIDGVVRVETAQVTPAAPAAVSLYNWANFGGF